MEETRLPDARYAIFRDRQHEYYRAVPLADYTLAQLLARAAQEGYRHQYFVGIQVREEFEGNEDYTIEEPEPASTGAALPAVEITPEEATILTAALALYKAIAEGRLEAAYEVSARTEGAGLMNPVDAEQRLKEAAWAVGMRLPSREARTDRPYITDPLYFQIAPLLKRLNALDLPVK